MTLPGNPTALAERASSYISSAALIEQAADELRSLAYAGQSKALDAVREKSADVARDLDRAHERYFGTAHALQDYAVALKAAHQRADEGELAEARANAAGANADYNIVQLEQYVERLEEADAPDGSIRAAERRLADAQATARRYDTAAANGAAEIEAARRDMEAAAQEAMRRIENAIADTNEGFWDRVQKFFEDVGEFFANLAKWVGDFLSDVFHELMRILATVVALLGTVLILALIYLLLSAIPIIGPFIAALVTTLLASFLLGSVLSDVLKPTPQVSEREPTRDQLREYDGQPENLSEALQDTSLVDGLGTTTHPDGSKTVDETVISVVRVVDADGTVRWRVTLPSTQEWLSRLNGDQGGTNDLDSNLALMLTPALRTQYERAVLEAMQQAGVGPNDPVMLVGFSQGGIVAGHMAAYNNDYNWSAVVASGAPIDHMPIPPSTNVVSVQHNGDPVPRLDSIITVGTDGYAVNRPGWTTIQTDSPNAADGLHGIHNAQAYNETLGANIDQIPPEMRDDMDRYFSGHENTYGYEQSYYGWSEE